jgi:penicillin-binding protein 1A
VTTTSGHGHTRDAAPPLRQPGRGSGRRRRWRIVVRVVVAAVVLLAVLVAGLWVVTPSVADAESRIHARLRAHGAVDPHALPRPDPVGEAIVATEDNRFYSHHGVDPIGAVRALLGLAQGQADPGGATLDQQLAKNLYTPGRDELPSKVEQVVLSLKLESRYSKPQILEMYLSAVYFGHGYYGLPAAARGYFGTAPNALTWSQASLLAGLVQAPSAYDPYRHADLARSRQRHVLDRLVATGRLTRSEADAAFAASWHLR